jgi:hypothetical protein
MPHLAAAVLLWVLCAFVMVRAEQGAPVALIADLAGEVRLRPAAGVGDGRAAELMQRLQEDATLALGADARATVFYPGTGTAFELRGVGMFSVGADETRAEGGAANPVRRQLNAAFRGIQLQRVHITQAGVVMRSAVNGNRPQPLAPEGLVMSGGSLVFRWTAADGGGRYRFRLTDSAGESLYETSTTEVELALPPNVTVPAGRRLMWSVQAAGRLSPNRWANLIVADSAVRQMAAEFDHAGDPASEAERNLRVLLLTQNALRGE